MKQKLALLTASVICLSALNSLPLTVQAENQTRKAVYTSDSTTDALQPFQAVGAEAFSEASGVEIGSNDAGGKMLCEIEAGDYVMYRNVDFGEGAAMFTVRVASGAQGGTVEVHLDDPVGPIVGVCTFGSTGGWDAWSDVSCQVSGASGTHDLYLRFSGDSGTLFRVASWQFAKERSEAVANLDFTKAFITAADSTTYFHSTFENGEDDWTGRGSASVVATNNGHFEGNQSLYVSGRAEAWNGAMKNLGSDFVAGQAYSFSANVMYEKGKKSTDTFFMKLQYTNANDETDYISIAEGTALKGDWIQLANTNFELPSGATDMSIYIETEDSTNSFYVDDVTAASAGTVIKGAGNVGFILGDVDGNGVINAEDVAMAKQGFMLGAYQTYHAECGADVNQSGTVTAADIIWLQKYVSCGETDYPEVAPPENPTTVSDDFDYDPALSYHPCPDSYFNPISNGGTITKESYNSINGYKSLWVYTPNGYDPSQKYNIFYLMHGGGENENLLFSDEVHLKEMLDHAIADGLLDPLIVVTPTFNGGNCSAETFYKEFRSDVVPFVEGKYSTYAESTSAEDIEASRMHRAYGGFSMGAVSTWAVMVNDLDMVGYFMPLSGDHWGANSAEGKAQDVANAIDRFGYEKDECFIFAATGSDDIAYPNESPQIEAMKKLPQFTYTSDFSQGNLYFMVAPGLTHWWGYVRHYVIEILPYFFHENQ